MNIILKKHAPPRSLVKSGPQEKVLGWVGYPRDLSLAEGPERNSIRGFTSRTKIVEEKPFHLSTRLVGQ